MPFSLLPCLSANFPAIGVIIAHKRYYTLKILPAWSLEKPSLVCKNAFEILENPKNDENEKAVPISKSQ